MNFSARNGTKWSVGMPNLRLPFANEVGSDPGIGRLNLIDGFSR